MSDKPDDRVNLRLPDGERRALEEVAREEDRTLSAQVRRYIREGLRRDGRLK